MSTPEQRVPPTGEEIHLPGPSLIPIFSAVGITFIVIGTTVGYWLMIVGGVIFIYTTIRWIAETRREMMAAGTRPPRVMQTIALKSRLRPASRQASARASRWN